MACDPYIPARFFARNTSEKWASALLHWLARWVSPPNRKQHPARAWWRFGGHGFAIGCLPGYHSRVLAQPADSVRTPQGGAGAWGRDCSHSTATGCLIRTGVPLVTFLLWMIGPPAKRSIIRQHVVAEVGHLQGRKRNHAKAMHMKKVIPYGNGLSH